MLYQALAMSLHFHGGQTRLLPPLDCDQLEEGQIVHHVDVREARCMMYASWSRTLLEAL